MSVPPGLPLAAVRFAYLAAASLVTAEAFARAGATLTGTGGRNALRRFGIAFLAGLAVVSGGFLGLALTGLFYPSLMSCLAVAAVVAGSVGGRRAFVPGVVRMLRGEGSFLPSLAVLAAAVPALVTLLVPESDGDAMGYGLGAGWLSLQLHRAPLEMVPQVFHLPLLIEQVFALPLALGDDRLARCVSALAVAAAFCVTAPPAGRTGKGGGWLAAVLPWSLALLPYISGRCKSDAAAASFMVAGAFLRLDGRTGLAALLTGAAVATKLTCAPLAMVFWVVLPPPPGRVVRACVSVLAPLLPWLVKNWLATGDPLYPILWRVFRPFSWGGMNDASYVAHATPLWERGFRGAVAPGALLTSFSREATLALVALPLLLGKWEGRRAAWAALAGAGATVLISRVPRYLMPAEWLLLALLARRLAAGPFLPLPFLRRPALMGAVPLVLALWCAARSWTVLPPGESLREAGEPFAAARARALGMTGEGAELAGRFRFPRLLAVDTAIYPYPCRILFAGGESETPLVWQWTRDSSDPGRLAVRFRQAGATGLLHNYMNSGWAIIRERCFGWDARMLRLYLDFCTNRLVAVGQSPHRDRSAGFTAFRVVSPSGGRRPPPYFIPGAEGVLARAWIMRGNGRTDLALAELAGLHSLLPGVGIVVAEAGSALGLMNDWKGALRAMAPAMEAGLMDSTNFLVYGRAALENGKWALADSVLGRMEVGYPEAGVIARIMRARAVAELALQALARGDRGSARREMERADGLMAGAEAPDDPWAVEELLLSRAKVEDAWRKVGGR